MKFPGCRITHETNGPLYAHTTISASSLATLQRGTDKLLRRYRAFYVFPGPMLKYYRSLP
jgi:hypothetical protein